MNKENLSIILKKVKENKALIKDYAYIDDNMHLVIADFKNHLIISLLNENGFENYKEFIEDRKKPIGMGKAEASILGKILGTISAMITLSKNSKSVFDKIAIHFAFYKTMEIMKESIENEEYLDTTTNYTENNVHDIKFENKEVQEIYDGWLAEYSVSINQIKKEHERE